jgi:hypothetical protein
MYFIEHQIFSMKISGILFRYLVYRLLRVDLHIYDPRLGTYSRFHLHETVCEFGGANLHRFNSREYPHFCEWRGRCLRHSQNGESALIARSRVKQQLLPQL